MAETAAKLKVKIKGIFIAKQKTKLLCFIAKLLGCKVEIDVSLEKTV